MHAGGELPMNQGIENSKEPLPLAAWEAHYQEITVLYDFAEELVATVENPLVSDPDVQLALIEPLINDLGEATDVLSEEFINIAESRKRNVPLKVRKGQVEAALRKIYLAMDEYRMRVSTRAAKSRDVIANVADGIVDRIHRQVEKIIVVFLDFVQLALDTVMHKHHLDLLRQRQAQVALALHKMGSAPQ